MSSLQAAAVSLFAVGNGLGRLVAGPLSDLTHRRRICPRALWLCCATCIMAAGHAILVLPQLGALQIMFKIVCIDFCVPIDAFRATGTFGLYLGVLCVGCSFGSMFTLNVVISSELWGLRHHGESLLLMHGIVEAISSNLHKTEIVCARCKLHAL